MPKFVLVHGKDGPYILNLDHVAVVRYGLAKSGEKPKSADVYLSSGGDPIEVRGEGPVETLLVLFKDSLPI